MKSNIWFIFVVGLMMSLSLVSAASVTTQDSGIISGFEKVIVNQTGEFKFTPIADAGRTWSSCSIYTNKGGAGFILDNTITSVTNNAVNTINLSGLTNLKQKFQWKVGCVDDLGAQTNSTSRDVYVFTKSKLLITYVNIDYEEQSRSSTDGETAEFDFDDVFTGQIDIDRVAQNSDVEIEVGVVNLWDASLDERDTEMDAILYVESEDTSDIDDVDADFKTIDAEDEEDTKVTLTIPIDVLEDNDDDQFDFSIIVEGEDGDRRDHDDQLTLTLGIEKPDTWLHISDVSLSRSALTCVRDTTLRVKYSNAGQDRLDEVMLYAYSDDLDFSYVRRDIELDDDVTDYEVESIPVSVSKTQAPGTYRINIRFYDNNDEDDLLDGGITYMDLVVGTCVDTTPDEPVEDETQDEQTTDDSQDNSNDQTQIPVDYQPVVVQPSKTTSVGSGMESDVLVIGLLATLNVALLLVGAFLIIKYVKK